MAIIKDNSLRNFLDSEFANSGSGNSSSRNNLESGTTLERRDGAEVVNTNNNADVNLNRNNESFWYLRKWKFHCTRRGRF